MALSSVKLWMNYVTLCYIGVYINKLLHHGWDIACSSRSKYAQIVLFSVLQVLQGFPFSQRYLLFTERKIYSGLWKMTGFAIWPHADKWCERQEEIPGGVFWL